MSPNHSPGRAPRPRRALLSLLVSVALVLGSAALPARPAAAESDAKWTYVDLAITGTYVPLVGYFNHDKMTDILWYGPGALADSLWLGTTTKGSFTKKNINVGGTYKPIVGDFALDSYSDIFWYGVGTRPDVLWTANGSPEIFQSTPQEVNGEYYIMDSLGTTVYAKSTGGYVLRDLGFGKDDILWFGGKNATESYWRFDDTGNGTHQTKLISVADDYVVVRGNFSGGNSYDDVMLYRPGTKVDYIWTSDGTGRFSQRQVSVNGIYQPVTIARNELSPPAEGAPAMDAIYWFDRDHCGKTSPIWHFASGGSWSTRYGNIAQGSSCSKGLQVFPFEGTSSAVVYSQAGSDYQVFDRNASVRVEGLTPGARDYRFTESVVKYATGDFNGDGIADILWYQAGTAADAIWYGRQVMVKDGGDNTFNPRTNPDGIPPAPYQN